ncbi:ubiquinol-cytochrome c reductase iron-sulfur subunit [Thalassospira sp. TSL5-1]|uniref:ubiquinol-cytochrome c reductase iron-sulfur subunit n=1 Tax=Thalassospira sp. TSL5-1 TaxID=1544451 RepID=UPI00093F89D7|nr:ubiquinol-cytochrome c reductase iron-sulfur subunit [Thalassospira sp. TSL5-1]OKH88005.1 ubiquinol-cytochrome C reductase [Thalassospira sp. TSL5-1]
MSQTAQSSGEHPDENRRDFLTLATTAVGVVGTGMALWPFVDSMNPSKDVLALASVEVNLSNIPVGQAIKVMWRGKPVFIRHRTEREIKEAEDVALNQLVDPEADDARVKKKEWLIVVGVCTHLGCIPMGTATGEPRGDFDGWYCPCHGSHYDSSGRIRKGPAPKNLVVPTYTFLTDTSVKIG